MGLHTCMTRIHQHSLLQSRFTALKSLWAPPTHLSLPADPTDHFTVSVALSFAERHIVGIIQCVAIGELLT